MNKISIIVIAVATLGVVLFGSYASVAEARDSGENSGRDRPNTFQTQVVAHPYDVILGRPTEDSITLSLLAYESRAVYVAYGTNPNEMGQRSQQISLSADVPKELELKALKPDTDYFFKIYESATDQVIALTAQEWRFHTQRSSGKTFKFTVTADSHLDANSSLEYYKNTLNSVATQNPDFHIDLGDTFMTDKYGHEFRDAKSQYLAQRYWFGFLKKPLFLVIGNHDGETGNVHGSQEGMTEWSTTMRKTYFPNPEPNHFYRGNSTSHSQLGMRQNYYSWTWGDALFIVLDPYMNSVKKPRSTEDNWFSTLGFEQYEWLGKTLESSNAAFKFIFIHQLVGGSDRNGRGGIEAASLFEWGGHDMQGKNVFEEKRSGWESPIHNLLARHNVSAVFHGHDHFYAKQDLDDIVYQLVPQPGHQGDRYPNQAKEYGYQQGEILGGSGYLLVEVGEEVMVSFIKTVVTKDGKHSEENAYSYQIR